MDTTPWDVHQVHTGRLRKRPRDVESTSTEASAGGSGYSSHLGIHDTLGESEWKRRRNTSQPNANVWETCVQTSLWLDQQNNLAPIESMNREHSEQSYQRNEAEQALSRDEPLKPVQNWAGRAEDAHRPQSQEGRGFYGRESFAHTTSSKMSDPERLSSEILMTRNDMQETAAPQPRKATNLAGIESRCERCYHTEPLLRDSAINLNKLWESMVAGPLSEIIMQSRKNGLLHEQIPQISDVHRVLELVQEASDLANQVIQAATPYLHNVKKETAFPSNEVPSSLETMKRRFLADSQDVLERQRRRSSDIHVNLDAREYHPPGLPEPPTLGGSPHRQSNVGMVSNDVLPPIRTQSPSHTSSDGYGTRLPSMKPPPTPGRQLPSPPGRSHPSPPSYNVSSPSSFFYPPSVTSTTAPAQSSSMANILHPLSPTPSTSVGTSTAIQAHTAALQHEVSVKKYALQTLQSEHDKLLATLRRSQTRARALEEKQVASDLEINTLAEERVRLLTQVQELEQSITDTSKSRDEFRQAAVKGGAQYVKIVRMASQLEMMAGEERREWKRKLEENRVTIDALREAQAGQKTSLESTGSLADPQTLSLSSTGSAEELKREVQRLRIQCTEMETALKRIRGESDKFGEAVTALSSAAERIFESAAGSALVLPATDDIAR